MYLGIDLGTGSVKALVMDVNGVTLAEASASYSVERAQPGWSETHPQTWWTKTGEAVGSLPGELRRGVKALGCAGQMHGVVLTDLAAKPLRPAILWPDRRAQQETAAYSDAAKRIVANPITPGMAGPILLWLKAHEPRVYDRAIYALQPKDWLRFKLCGELGSDPSDATGTLLAAVGGSWSDQLVHDLGLRRDWLAPIKGSGDIAGALSDQSASELGLPAALPVIVGAGDTAAAMIGSGLTKSGQAQLTVGSGAQIVVLADQAPSFHPRLNAYRTAAPIGARWYVIAAMQNAGTALEWARNLLSLSWPDAYAAAFGNHNDGHDLLFLPYLSGERTPLMDTHARGAWIGLSSEHTQAALMRAAFEGVAFSVRAGLDELEAAGFQLQCLRVAGGGTLDARWRDLLARILRKPLVAVSAPNASARGAALLAATALEHWRGDDLAALAPALTPLCEPGEDRALAQRYARYRDLYPRLKDWFADIG